LIAEKVLERGGVGQGGGATVPLLDAHQFDQLMAIRSNLEPMATAAAARLATTEALDGLERSMLDMKKSIESAQGARYLAAHNRFHFGIYKMSQLPIVQEVIEGAWLRCGPTLNLALPEYKPGLKRYAHHVDALNALKKRDADTAAAAIHADIESARADVYALLIDRQPN
jgi:DNA-binding GntR family transcriptional regulator